MRQAFSCIRIFSLVLVVGGGAAACGDDDGGGDDDGSGGQVDAGNNPDAGGGAADAGGDDGGEPDAGTEPDAGPPAPARIWVHGDFVTDGRLQVGAYVVGDEVLPAIASPLFPTGDTAVLATGASPNSGNYDFSRNGDFVALPADLEVPGRFDLYGGPTDGSAELTQTVAMTDNADVDKVRVSPDGAVVAFTADLDADGVLSAYIVPSDAVRATPTLVSPAGAVDDVDDLVWSRNSNSLLVTGAFTEPQFYELILVDLTGTAPDFVPLIARDDITSTTPPQSSAGVLQPLVRLGTTIIFKGRMEADNRNKLYVIDTAGTGQAEVLPNSQLMRDDGTTAVLGRVDISPDGNQLAFASDQAQNGIFDLFVMPSNGGAAAQQVTTGLTFGAPTTGNPIKWRPDNQALAVIATWGGLNGKDEPFVVPLDGSGQTRLANVGAGVNTVDAESVDWSPDGSQVFVVANYLVPAEFELFSLDPAATDQTDPVQVFDVVTGGTLRDDITLTR
jgi:Tol biopolymer transport system component